jgi:protein-L-isoaspartate(D-aspartate) O-methyltransferase
MASDLATQRKRLLAELQRAGVQDERVLVALTSVPREHFVGPKLQKLAYSNRALPTCMGQTISQPLMVAIMTQALSLQGDERVLEIGTGSGYQTAILTRLAAYVYSIERYQQLAFLAAQRLARLAVHNVSLYVADGSLGWPAEAPYDRILVTAAAPTVPAHLLEQLTPGGMMVLPVGSQQRQDLQVIQRTAEGTRVQILGQCVFVPLIGEEGWHEYK